MFGLKTSILILMPILITVLSYVAVSGSCPELKKILQPDHYKMLSFDTHKTDCLHHPGADFYSVSYVKRLGSNPLCGRAAILHRDAVVAVELMMGSPSNLRAIDCGKLVERECHSLKKCKVTWIVPQNTQSGMTCNLPYSHTNVTVNFGGLQHCLNNPPSVILDKDKMTLQNCPMANLPSVLNSAQTCSYEIKDKDIVHYLFKQDDFYYPVIMTRNVDNVYISTCLLNSSCSGGVPSSSSVMRTFDLGLQDNDDQVVHLNLHATPYPMCTGMFVFDIITNRCVLNNITVAIIIVTIFIVLSGLIFIVALNFHLQDSSRLLHSDISKFYLLKSSEQEADNSLSQVLY